MMGIERRLVWPGFDTLARPLRSEAPALLIVAQIGDHDLLEDLLVHGRVVDRQHRFDSAVEIARHQIRRGDIDMGLLVRKSMTAAEAIDAAMLEETPDD